MIRTTHIVSAILKGVLLVKPIMMLKSIYHKAFIFHYSKNYDSMTTQTKFKVELNTYDLTCLFSRQFESLNWAKACWNASAILTEWKTHAIPKGKESNVRSEMTKAETSKRLFFDCISQNCKTGQHNHLPTVSYKFHEIPQSARKA